MKEEPARDSYGLNVARLAGLGAALLKVAAERAAWMRRTGTAGTDSGRRRTLQEEGEEEQGEGKKRRVEVGLCEAEPF